MYCYFDYIEYDYIYPLYVLYNTLVTLIKDTFDYR